MAERSVRPSGASPFKRTDGKISRFRYLWRDRPEARRNAMSDSPHFWKRLLGVTAAEKGEARQEASIDEADFAKRSLDAWKLAEEFGYDPKKVTLSRESSSFVLGGESCMAEGRAFLNGNIAIYYDPNMTRARMGCCIAHEVQHQKYNLVRRAFHREATDGPLHAAFAKFTPRLLEQNAGVSDYAAEHWSAWKSAAPPALFSYEKIRGGSEPINETLAEIAKAKYNYGPQFRINPVWSELYDLINAEYARLTKP
jgi:hypothetical protein